MFFGGGRIHSIKDLKDLRAILCPRVTIDMQVLTDLKRHSFTVGRGPVPRRASIGTENGLGQWVVFARVERSRGPVPRATVCKAGSVSP